MFYKLFPPNKISVPLLGGLLMRISRRMKGGFEFLLKNSSGKSFPAGSKHRFKKKRPCFRGEKFNLLSPPSRNIFVFQVLLRDSGRQQLNELRQQLCLHPEQLFFFFLKSGPHLPLFESYTRSKCCKKVSVATCVVFLWCICCLAHIQPLIRALLRPPPLPAHPARLPLPCRQLTGWNPQVEELCQRVPWPETEKDRPKDGADRTPGESGGDDDGPEERAEVDSVHSSLRWAARGGGCWLPAL